MNRCRGNLKNAREHNSNYKRLTSEASAFTMLSGFGE
jgi:hypothetical protein